MRAKALLVCAGLMAVCVQAEAAPQTLWLFDNLKQVGGWPLKVEGHPSLVSAPGGKAVAFDGKQDALFLPDHPLAGARTYTIEAVFRPDGGDNQQRWLHLAQTDPVTGLDVTPGTDTTPRFLMEIRVVGKQWYLDAFANSTTGSAVLALPEKLHPIGPWYHVAQVYDGKTLRSYVDGKLEGEAPLPKFTPHGKGHASVGVRINHVNYFHGAVRAVRFTDEALAPSRFLKTSR